MDKLKNTRILGGIGIIALLLGVILPYVKFSFLGYSQTISLWGYWEGKIMILLILANTLFIFKDYVERYVPQLFNSNIGQKIKNANEKLVLVPTILVVIFAIYLYTTIDVDSKYLEHGLGFWLLWIGVILLVAHCFIYKKTISSDFNSQNQQSLNNNITNGNANTKRCPSCGNICSTQSDRCVMCGNQLK